MQSAHRDAGTPRRLGRYELLFRIAAGGMAEVYAARVSGEAGFQKLVAVKRMLPNLADDDEFVTMFLDEARVAANIESPHVVATHDLGRADDGSLYIAMELVVGVTLSRILRTHARRNAWVPIPVAVELLRQAAQGLDDAHQATTPVGAPLQIVHRDVSPQNILAGIDGRVRLTDFGVARAVLRMTHTVGGRVKGKFAYASPEQLAAHEVDRRSDVFSLGVVAWELFTGQRLFMGEHPAETIERVRTMPIPAVHHVRSDVPRPISDLVAAALERDVRRRVPSARAFAAHLVEAARACGVPAVEREQLRRFISDAGGEDLQKMKTNIKRAMENRSALEALADAPQIEGTPSTGGTSGVIIREATSGPTTEKEVTRASAPHPDDSAAIRGPGSLIASAPRERPRGRPLVAVIAGLLLLGVGSAVGWWLTRDEGEGVVRSLPPEPSATAPSEPVTPTAPELEPVPEPSPPPDTLVADDPAADPPSRTRRRASRRDRTTAMAAAEPPPPAMTEPVAQRQPIAEPPPPQRTEPRPQSDRTTERTTETAMTKRTSGFVGLDAFERDLEQRR